MLLMKMAIMMMALLMLLIMMMMMTMMKTSTKKTNYIIGPTRKYMIMKIMISAISSIYAIFTQHYFRKVKR